MTEKEIEILKTPGELKEKPKPEEVKIDNFMARWRHSEFYPFVIRIVEEAMRRKYLEEVMSARFAEGQPMDDTEIGQQARIDFQTGVRIKNDILDVLS